MLEAGGHGSPGGQHQHPADTFESRGESQPTFTSPIQPLGTEEEGTFNARMSPASTVRLPGVPSPRGSLGELSPFAVKAEEVPATWQRLSSELTLGISDEWPHLPAFRRRWRAVTFPVLCPMYALLRLTVPLVDPASYSQQARGHELPGIANT